MTTPSKLEKRVSRLEHDIDAIYELVADIQRVQKRHTADIAVLKSDVAVLKSDVAVLKSDVAVLKSDVASLKGSVAELATASAAHTRRFDTVDSSLAEILRRLPEAS